MAHRSSLTVCGIFSRRRAESSSPPESPTKRTVFLASLLKTKIRNAADWGAHASLTVATRVLFRQGCALTTPRAFRCPILILVNRQHECQKLRFERLLVPWHPVHAGLKTKTLLLFI